MNIKQTLILLLLIICGCTSSTDNPEFLKNISGRYLFNADEELTVFSENGKMFLSWRGADKIEPLKVGDGIYFIKEMNEKIQFRKNPTDNKYYISLTPKSDTVKIGYDFAKLSEGEHIPSYYLKNNQFDKALEAYRAIKEKDSLNIIIEEAYLNRMGYSMMNDRKMDFAINLFRLNVELYPESSNVYDSLGDALFRNGDTIGSIENYKKALELDSGNRRAKRIIDKYDN